MASFSRSAQLPESTSVLGGAIPKERTEGNKQDGLEPVFNQHPPLREVNCPMNGKTQSMSVLGGAIPKKPTEGNKQDGLKEAFNQQPPLREVNWPMNEKTQSMSVLGGAIPKKPTEGNKQDGLKEAFNQQPPLRDVNWPMNEKPQSTSVLGGAIPKKPTEGNKQDGLKPAFNQHPPVRDVSWPMNGRTPFPFRHAKPKKGLPGFGSVVDEISEDLGRASLSELGAEAAPPKEETSAFVDKAPESFSTSMLPLGVPDVDADEENKIILCSEYAKEIFDYLASLEVEWPIDPHFLSDQTSITANMRHILVVWMMQVHKQFYMLQETLFVAVSIVDRYLQAKPVDRSEFQLLGTTALFLACKYEETSVPRLRDLTGMTGGACVPEDVCRLEQSVLDVIEWGLGRPSPLHFIRRIARGGNVDATSFFMAKYALELCLLRHDMSSVRPSEQAAAAICLALRVVTNDAKRWDATFTYYSRYTEQELQPTIKRMANIMLDGPTTFGLVVFEKYQRRRFDNVSGRAAADSATLRWIAKNGTL